MERGAPEMGREKKYGLQGRSLWSPRNRCILVVKSGGLGRSSMRSIRVSDRPVRNREKSTGFPRKKGDTAITAVASFITADSFSYQQIPFQLSCQSLNSRSLKRLEIVIRAIENVDQVVKIGYRHKAGHIH